MKITKCCLVHNTNIHIIKWVAELSNIHLVGEEMYLKQQIKTLPTLSLVFSFDSFFLPFFLSKTTHPHHCNLLRLLFQEVYQKHFQMQQFSVE